MREQERVLARLGTSEEAAILRAKMQSSSLISDMQAFKVTMATQEPPHKFLLYMMSTVGIGWVLLASATSGFSGYIKLAYCSSAKGL